MKVRPGELHFRAGIGRTCSAATRIDGIGKEKDLEYFWGSVKLMLIVYGLAAFIAMLVAWVIKLIFAGIRRQRDSAAAKAPPAVDSKPAGSASGKAI